MAFVDADGLVHTDEDEEHVDGEEDDLEEYTEDEEIDGDEEYSEEEDGMIEEGDESGDEEEEDDPTAEYIQSLHPLPDSSAARAQPKAAQAWDGLRELPAATQTALFEQLAQLRKAGRKELTILLLGKCGMGKSSTTNSIFKEHVAQPSMFQGDTDKPVVVSRQAGGFTLTVIDTPGLLDVDCLSQSALDSIAAEVKQRKVDAVLWVDRLDVYRVESLDRQAMAGVTRTLGKDIWNYTVLAFTHGKLQPPSIEQTYDEFVMQRADAVRAAMRKAGSGNAPLPAVLVENSSRCDKNDGGESVLPSGVAWLPALMQEVAQMASSHAAPFVVDPKAKAKADPNKRHRWFIPLLLAAQIAFKVFVLDRVLEEDGITGDQYGPYDEEFIAEERDRQQYDKALRKKRKELEAKQRKRKAARQAAPTQQSASEDDDDEEYEDDSE